jgi:hypothetical protein
MVQLHCINGHTSDHGGAVSVLSSGKKKLSLRCLRR